MRFRHWPLLGILLVFMLSLSFGRESLLGQSAQVDNAQSQLVQAFILVQQADMDGASPGQVSLLASSLNLALAYEENATQLFAKNTTQSNFYAGKSASLANATSAQAQSIASAARTQAFLDQAATYSIAVAAGFGSALLVLEIHRLEDLARKFRLRRVRLD
jgi:hypothetical protein